MSGLGEGEAVDSPGVVGVLTRAASVSLLKPLGKFALAEYGMDEPAAEVSLRTEEGSEVTLSIGAFDPVENAYVVRSSTSEYYVLVSASSLQTIVEAVRDDFVVIQSGPTPESGS